MAELKKVAIIYDFDYTLISGNMQDNTLIPMFDMSVSEYWQYSDSVMINNNMDQILASMYAPIKLAENKGIKLSKELLKSLGAKINTYYAGVEEWFDKITAYGKTIGLDVRHYIISAGFKEMIEGSIISDKVDKVFSCSYVYDSDGNAVWPAYVVNFTQKTQYISRICKNLTDVLYDSNGVNKKVGVSEQYISYKDMIYIGDGETDVPSMRMVRENGGKSICVYEEGREKAKKIAKELVYDGRVDCSLIADYTEDSSLYKQVKMYLDKFAKAK